MSKLSNSELSALHEQIISLSLSLGLALSEQIGKDVTLNVEQVTTVPMQDVMMRAESLLSTVFSLAGPFSAESLLLLTLPTARFLADLMDAGGESDAPSEATLEEAQVKLLATALQGGIRGLAAALAVSHGDNIEIESCNTQAGPLLLPPVFALDGDILEARMTLSAAGLEDGEATLLITPEWARGLIVAPVEAGGDSLSEDDLAAMLNDIGGLGGGLPGLPSALPSTSGAPPFANFPTSAEPLMPRGMNMIMDIPLDVTVELGRVRMLIKDVLELSMGSIVELDRVAGEPVDLLVNGRLVAKGEVVVIEDNFGIRITEIVSQADRLAGLGKVR